MKWCGGCAPKEGLRRSVCTCGAKVWSRLYIKDVKKKVKRFFVASFQCTFFTPPVYHKGARHTTDWTTQGCMYTSGVRD